MPAQRKSVEESDSSRPRRINVAINQEMLDIIDALIDREGVTLTEAVRRLVMYGGFVWRVARVEGQDLVCRDPRSGDTREIVLL